ncbi:SDR family NAD(P)-dependent oxidoreductase [Marinimicrobium sp. ABcell2]|uniref:SDR family NAD(P)-dependent oxidoreductase n=1 Tax=Marinimicrobium sp. ABcell2 TaxID=3069751 RepID=UPI0027ADC291|nr:SDR family NAD(P)-dependent oxidoreductase [Marinimicrobium sp. ABcell2]MDQ2075633.1 SDR family NAD(P)-dependent oxidoreductase [Marinimicrobium sp. ABcell2]
MEHSKTVLVTGASTGIGYYCAKALLSDGYRVIAACRKIADVSRLQAEGLSCIQLDLAKSESVQEAAREVLQLCQGQLYGLFNNAGYGQPGAVEDLSREALRQQFETNLFGLCELTNALLPAMFEQGQGRIIQNSSVLGFAAMPFRGAYNASKFALEGLTDTLRLELEGSGVYVSLIEPGPITSAFRKNALAALKANVDPSKSRLKETYELAFERLARTGPNSRFTLGPEAVYKPLRHALESRRPKARYYVTTPTYLMGYAKRLLSSRAMDWLLRRAGG